ncbi:type VII secretion protein EccCa [Actinocatenispora comari]|uniref:Type VII secretion protein EccC n=1 Tax=Actinocatenispora comari TaxID=2807577 RepID=A0A8J4ALI5_9ACTN|nr:type VII secretion protein EccCa [Actinocatenispora comari]GIL31652.1 type VII secretion protein EccC [Actinocatenispora comari]
MTSTIVVSRPARRHGPTLPSGELALEAPPEVPEQLPRGIGQLLMLLPMLAGAGAMAMLYTGRGGTLSYVAGGLFGVSMLGMFFGSMSGLGQDKTAQLDAERRDYLRYLAQMRRRARRAAAQQRASLIWTHPAPDALWSVVAGGRLWERRQTDADFGALRVAVGTQRMSVHLSTPETKPVEDLEPLSAIALRRFTTAHTNSLNVPVAIAIRSFSRITLRGADPTVLAVVRSLLCQYAAFHAPEDARVAVVASPDRRSRWDWVKWLPHAEAPGGGTLLVAGSLRELEELLGEEVANRPRHSKTAEPLTERPHLLVVLDGGEVSADAQLYGAGVQGATLLDLSGQIPRDADNWLLVLDVSAQAVTLFRGEQSAYRASDDDLAGLQHETLGTPDLLTDAQAAAFARALAPYRLSGSGGSDEPLATTFELSDLLGLGDAAALDPTLSWRTRPERERLRIPIGVGPDGSPVELDVKEAAQGGMGPHGLIIGATGSGKSELLRTLVLGLAATHSSEELNFVLVDFKGGATFTKLDALPHTSAVITNLSDELPLVDRMKDALSGELVRRQEVLRAAGNYVSQRDYERARRAGEPLEPLPALMIICDEFSELLSAKPDFIDLFVMIGRLGRSLGVHLLLASQRLEEGKLRGLDTHLSYRIGLRTFSAMESRIVLGNSAAHELPNAPGHGYLKTDTSTMLRFRAAYVSGPYRQVGSGEAAQHRARRSIAAFRIDLTAPAELPVGPTPPPAEQPAPVPAAKDQSTVLDVMVSRLRGHGRPAHQVWLPPLGDPPALSELLPPLSSDPQLGLTPTDWAPRGRLQVPLGVVDRPYEQRRDVLWAELAGAGGHVVVVGGPQSGKSTLTRALIGGLALTHTPREVQVYCLDLGGGALSSLRGLPHVGSVATRRDPELLRRTVAELTGLLAEREARFAEAGIDGMPTFRRRLAAGTLPEERFGDVLLVVDGWGTIRSEFTELEERITDLAARGLGYGIHVVITAARWAELRLNLRDLLGTRYELRLGDPAESEVDRRRAASVPERSPGRGLAADGKQFLVAVPRIDGISSVEDLASGVSGLVDAVATAWKHAPAPEVRLLPRIYQADDLPRPDDPAGVPIGLSETDLAPVRLDFATEPHMVLVGDTESGKTAFLRMLATQLVRRYRPEQARIIVGDYRRTLLGAVPESHLLEYAPSSDALRGALTSVADAMRKRLPGPDVTAEQLRTRSWWRGPELYLLIDDYDLVVTGSGNPVAALADLVPQARDIGLHLVLTRRIGGMSRAMYEPIVQSLRELNMPAMMLSGPRDEGILYGNRRPEPLPPGRGWLVRRRDGAQLVQLAYQPPTD